MTLDAGLVSRGRTSESVRQRYDRQLEDGAYLEDWRLVDRRIRFGALSSPLVDHD
jgi:hypothetical protein